MDGRKGWNRWLILGVALLLLGGVLNPVLAYKVKDPKANLDALTFGKPELWVTSQHVDLNEVRGIAPVPVAEAFDTLLTRENVRWVMVFDRVTGRPALMEGEGIPWIPGTANTLTGEVLGLGASVEGKDVPVEIVATKAMEFLKAYPELMGVDPAGLVLMPAASGPMLDYLYFIDFQWTFHGVPVEKAHLVFRLNHGNLVQVGQENIGPAIAHLDPIPGITLETAWEIVYGFAGREKEDYPVERGRLLVVPVSRPEALTGLPVTPGEGLDYRLAWVLSFRRPGVMGTWEARVDAHTGEILSFADSNRYGKIHGSAYPTDQPATEVDRPFPYTDTGLASPNNYADGGGLFTGNSATSTMTGKYVDIVDNCGAISLATTTGDLNFGASAATDCSTPGGGAGNTRASRTQFYNVTMVKIKALTYMPGNTWLQGVLTDNVNLNQTCNAYWDYTAVNFFRSGGGCWNTGELPGVSLHEWAHGMDSNDGSTSGDKGTGETYGDFTGSLQTHGSCAGGGFFYTINRGCGSASIGFNCGGYGDCCQNCSGIRELDYAKRASGLPTFAEDLTSNTCTGCTTFACSTSSTYAGPCGYEGHCESLISSQAMWDLPVRDLVTWGLDIDTAWQTMDRYWYASRGTSTNAYACPSLTTTNGCGTGNYFTTFRVVDDCDGNLDNGTPHASAIYAAFNRHKIACTTVVNTDQVGCCPTFTPDPPVLSGAAGSNSAVLSWGAVANAAKYYVYRNESGCSAGYTKVGTVTAPTANYTDTTVVNGVTYYYRLQGIGSSDACTTAMSNCATVTPQPCAGAVTLARSLYSCADTVSVTVLDSTVTLPVTVQAWSTTEANPKTITLTDAGSATYTGSFTTTAGSAGATQVRVSNGDTLTVRYTDPDYCGTPNQQVSTTGSVDCVGPTISNVIVTNITDSSATVTWTTNENANSRVTYGTSTPPGTNGDDLTHYVTSHSVTITGLLACTTYYFSATSADVASNSTTNTNGGNYFSFTTAGRSFALPMDTVEGGVLSWVVSPTSGTDIWHQDTCKAVSGTHSWKCGKSDAPTCTSQYASSLSNYYLTWNANITLGSAGHGYHLRFNEWYDTESNTGCTYDPLRTQISTDGGTTWTTLATNCGASGGWLARDYDLAAYTGNTVRIRFYFTSDSSANGLGWFVDDINISKSQGCSADVTYQSHTRTDACSGTGSGNNNGIWDPGEDATVAITAVNGGMSNATNVSGTLSTTTPGVTVTNATTTFPNMTASGGTGVSQAPQFVVRADPGITCGTTVNLNLHTTSTENPSGSDSAFTMTVGQAGGTMTAYSEAFSGVTAPALPTGWTTIVTTGNAWVSNATGCTGNALMYPYNSTAAANSWAFTPGVALTAGVTYTMAFNQKVYSASYAEAMEVKCGTAATVAGQTITILSLTGLVNTVCTARSATFTVPTTGTYFFGWHCTSAANMWNLYVDDIAVTYTQAASCNVCTVSTCTAPGAPNLTTATGTCSGVTLNWTAGTGTTNAYNVYRSSNTSCPVGTLTKLNASPLSSSTLTYNDTTAVAGTSYTYVVRGACDAGGVTESANSNCRAAARLVSPTPTITGASANTCPATTVVLTTESEKSGYVWYNGGTPIGGATAYQYTVTATGSYTVSYTDTNGCSGTSAAKAVTISACAPNIVYQGHGTFTAADTNGNATMEAGEKWSVQVTLQNTGNLAADNVQASLSGMALGDGITVCNNPGTFGTIAAGGTANYTFTFIVDTAKWYGTYTCGTNLTFNVVGKSTTTAGCACANEMAVFGNAVGTAAQNETATQVTTPLNATSGTANSNLASAFTITSPATTASLSYTSAYTPGAGTVTLFGPDDMANANNWTTVGTISTNTVAHCSPADNTYLRLSGNPSSITLATPVSTMGLTSIHLLYDYTESNINGSTFTVGWSTNGTTWNSQTLTNTTTWQCDQDWALPAGAENQATLYVRFVWNNATANRRGWVDYVRITGTAPSGSTWTANARVSLVDPSSTVTVLKAYGAADATPYNVASYYTGPGTYVIRLEENNGGTATLTAGSMNVTKTGNCANWTATCSGAAPGEAAPGDTPATAQGWTDKTTHMWPSTSGATSYKVYRGIQGQLPNLVNASTDSCTKYTGSSTNCTENDDPGSVVGRFYWYLVTATNGNGEGTAGNHTSGAGGPRVVNVSGNCP